MHCGGCGLVPLRQTKSQLASPTFGGSTGATPVEHSKKTPERCIKINKEKIYGGGAREGGGGYVLLLSLPPSEHLAFDVPWSRNRTAHTPVYLPEPELKKIKIHKWKGVTHPENNSVEEEDEFEEYVGESVAVADRVVAGHGASVCGQLASAPARRC